LKKLDPGSFRLGEILARRYGPRRRRGELPSNEIWLRDKGGRQHKEPEYCNSEKPVRHGVASVYRLELGVRNMRNVQTQALDPKIS
jgi:hypothetical protein